MEFILSLISKNAMIGFAGGILTTVINWASGKKIPFAHTVANVVCGTYVAHFSTPFMLSVINNYWSVQADESFVASLLGILGYKIVEFFLSGAVLNKLKDMFLLFLNSK